MLYATNGTLMYRRYIRYSATFSPFCTCPKNWTNRCYNMYMLIFLKLKGPVAESVVSLTSSLVVKMFTVLVSTIPNSQVFLLKKNVSSFCKCKSYSHFFSKNITIYAISNDQSFNNTLTYDIVSFEQLGPGWVVNIVNPDQTPRSVASYMGLHCLRKPFFFEHLR